jgi:hypothetical protein
MNPKPYIDEIDISIIVDKMRVVVDKQELIALESMIRGTYSGLGDGLFFKKIIQAAYSAGLQRNNNRKRNNG